MLLTPPNEGAFVEALNCCRVQIAVQWLGWFGNRPAPAAHSQDWLEEAVSLAARLAV